MDARVACLVIAVTSAVRDTAAQTPVRPVREAFVVETDGTAEKKLAAVAEYAAQKRWDAAVSLLREVSASRPDAFVRVSPRRSLALPLYCDVLRTRLPAEGLGAYRTGSDPQAAAWLSEADETGDERPLRSIAERAFATSAGDDALSRLAELAWERGDIDLARRYWTSLVPLGGSTGSEPPAVLRYPDAEVDAAAVRARLILCSVALGERQRAVREFAAFARLHPDASGRIAGREGRLAEILNELVVGAAEPNSDNGRDAWDVLPLTPMTRTFGQTASRSGVTSMGPLGGRPLWFRALPSGDYVADDGRPALPRLPPLSLFPVIWKDKAFVADAQRVFGFELATGKAAWGVSDDDPGVLYPAAAGLTLDSFGEGRPFASNPLAGAARYTLTVHQDRLYARLGPPITSRAARELRRDVSTLVCLDLAREGLLAWSVSSDSLGGADDWWAFEGPPVVDGDRAYVLATRSRPQAQLSALCLHARTGAVLWNRPLGAPITVPPEGLDVMTHRLASVAAGRLYVQTNQGAVLCLNALDGRPAWVGWYESHPPSPGPAANAPGRNVPAAPLVSGGVTVVAPSDSDVVFAYDAESGVELWSRAIRGGGRELVGARDGVLVLSGERLTGLDVFTGRDVWVAGFEDPAGFGAGRGLIAGGLVYWPTREDLFVVDIETGEPVRRLPLADAYGLVGGGNLAVTSDCLLLARPDGIVAIGE